VAAEAAVVNQRKILFMQFRKAAAPDTASGWVGVTSLRGAW